MKTKPFPNWGRSQSGIPIGMYDWRTLNDDRIDDHSLMILMSGKENPPSRDHQCRLHRPSPHMEDVAASWW